MKRAVLSSVLMALYLVTLAQVPESFNYQVVVREGTNPLTNQNVSFRMSILKGSSSGDSQYSELHSANTGSLGIVNLVIGNGTGKTGNITTIDWGADTYYLKVEIDKTGGSSYVEMGTTQLLSVPYALHSKTVASYTETDPIVKAITGIIKSNGTTISAATAGTDYLTPTGSAALLTNFPILNQSTTGSAAYFTGNLYGEVTGTQGATLVTNSAVLGKVLTGYVSGAGTVAATDNILQAIQKLNGNNPAHYIGESYGGGIVFYVYDNGRHGLIAATADQIAGVVWTNTAFQSTVSNAVRDGINGGLANTERIIIQAGAGIYAAQLCANYKGGNYADWYLPSQYELNLLYLQKAVVGGFADVHYWSSTEYTSYGAYAQDFANGPQEYVNKENTSYVRAIRAF